MGTYRHTGKALLAIWCGVWAVAALDGHDRPRYEKPRDQKFRHSGKIKPEGPPGAFSFRRADFCPPPDAIEAPVGFDNLTNGFLPQGPDFDTLTPDNVVPLRSFNDDRFIFDAVEDIPDGLGPTYNGQSCRECHQNVVSGGASQVAEVRVARVDDGAFFESIGGSLQQARATNPDIVEQVEGDGNIIRALRISTNTLGNGFVESIANSTLLAIRDNQPGELRGTAVKVPVLEGNGDARIGRFGWKSQQASLQSFSADAYLNEMGITNPLFPDENTSNGRYVGYGTPFDPVPELEDDGTDVLAFADFMRSTTAPDRRVYFALPPADVIAGERIFETIGCANCHVPTIVTAPPGTVINTGTFTVPPALGNKIIHPYSDFLLHDIGTGDGIPIFPTPEYASTANQIRTAPLWALRTRNRLMHDGLSYYKTDAIQRHAGQATSVTERFNALPARKRAQLLAFLDSL